MLCGGSDAAIIPIGSSVVLDYLKESIFHYHHYCFLYELYLKHAFSEYWTCILKDWEVLWHAEHFHRGMVIQLKLLAPGMLYVSVTFPLDSIFKFFLKDSVAWFWIGLCAWPMF